MDDWDRARISGVTTLKWQANYKKFGNNQNLLVSGFLESTSDNFPINIQKWQVYMCHTKNTGHIYTRVKTKGTAPSWNVCTC